MARRRRPNAAQRAAATTTLTRARNAERGRPRTPRQQAAALANSPTPGTTTSHTGALPSPRHPPSPPSPMGVGGAQSRTRTPAVTPPSHSLSPTWCVSPIGGRVERPCGSCGQVFEVKQRNSVYCGERCKKRAQRGAARRPSRPSCNCCPRLVRSQSAISPQEAENRYERLSIVEQRFRRSEALFDASVQVSRPPRTHSCCLSKLIILAGQRLGTPGRCASGPQQHHLRR